MGRHVNWAATRGVNMICIATRIAWCSITAEMSNRRPVGHDRKGWRSNFRKFRRPIDGFAIDDGKNRFQALDPFFRHGEIIFRENCEIGQLADGDFTFLADLM